MAKVYTAQEMRIRATFEKNVWGDDSTAEMLRQAADLMEREEKRPKKYEASIRYAGRGRYATFIREVGEWEEVKNGK